MDRTEFEIRDQGYQEDRQKLIDDKSADINPAFDQKLQKANASYMERLRVIRNSEYIIEDRNRIEQQELENHNANLAAIEADKEAAINEVIAPDDQKLQEILFGEGGREAAEQRMLEYEGTMEREQQLEAQNEAETPEAENAQDYFNADDFDYSGINKNYDSLSEEYNDNAPEGFEPTSTDHGLEP